VCAACGFRPTVFARSIAVPCGPCLFPRSLRVALHAFAALPIQAHTLKMYVILRQTFASHRLLTLAVLYTFAVKDTLALEQLSDLLTIAEFHRIAISAFYSQYTFIFFGRNLLS